MSRAYDNAADARFQQGGRRNLIINGDFQVWQRGTSITPASGYGYTTDRWQGYSYGSSTTTVSRQTFTLGQTDVPGSPQYYLRCTSTNSRPYLEHRIENVSQFSGQTITASFWAKSSDVDDVRMSFFSVFGSGGSTTVNEISDEVLGSLTSSWQKFTKTITVSSYSGKTIGADDYFGLSITTATSDVGSIDVALVQLELGNVATPFEHRSYGEELALCQRYYYKYIDVAESGSTHGGVGVFYSTTDGRFAVLPPVNMRSRPSLDYSGSFRLYSNGQNDVITTWTLTVGNENIFLVQTTQGSATSGVASFLYCDASESAYMAFYAEL